MGPQQQQSILQRNGLVRCEHCARHFNAHSAARHIPWCQKQRLDARRHRPSPDKQLALERYKWRINYRPASDEQRRKQQASLSSVNTTSSQASSSSGSFASSHTYPMTSSTAKRPATRVQMSTRTVQQQQQQQRQRPIEATRKSSISSGSLIIMSANQANGEQRRPEGSASSRGSRISSDTLMLSAAAHPTGLASKRRLCKSTSELAEMGALVEQLAMRMEHICAQNELLLARLAREPNQPRCRHCGTGLLAAEANFCHECGCNLQLAAHEPRPASQSSASDA